MIGVTTALLERVTWGEPVSYTSELSARLDEPVPYNSSFGDMKSLPDYGTSDGTMGLYDFWLTATMLRPYLGSAAYHILYMENPNVSVGEIAFVLARFPHAFDQLKAANAERFMPHLHEFDNRQYEAIAWHCLYTDIWNMVNSKENSRELDIDPNDLIREAISLGISFDEYVPFIRDHITANPKLIRIMLDDDIDYALASALGGVA